MQNFYSKGSSFSARMSPTPASPWSNLLARSRSTMACRGVGVAGYLRPAVDDVGSPRGGGGVPPCVVEGAPGVHGAPPGAHGAGHPLPRTHLGCTLHPTSSVVVRTWWPGLTGTCGRRPRAGLPGTNHMQPLASVAASMGNLDRATPPPTRRRGRACPAGPASRTRPGATGSPPPTRPPCWAGGLGTDGGPPDQHVEVKHHVRAEELLG